jgi:cysteine synthase
MCRQLAREEALFVGASTGTNAVAALEVAAKRGPAATVVSLMVDPGFRYLSKDLFRAA